MKENIYHKTKKELIQEVKSLMQSLEFYKGFYDLYKSERSYRIAYEPDAWDVRRVMPLVEFCIKYLDVKDITTAFSLVEKGKLQSQVFKYKNRNTDKTYKRVSLIPLTRQNLSLAKNYNYTTYKQRLYKRIIQLELQGKLDIIPIPLLEAKEKGCSSLQDE